MAKRRHRHKHKCMHAHTQIHTNIHFHGFAKIWRNMLSLCWQINFMLSLCWQINLKYICTSKAKSHRKKDIDSDHTMLKFGSSLWFFDHLTKPVGWLVETSPFYSIYSLPSLTWHAFKTFLKNLHIRKFSRIFTCEWVWKRW